MKTCTTCSKRIYTEPLRVNTDEDFFCSMDCLPEGVMDEPYGLAYVSLMERYIDLATDPREFESITERDEQLELIDEVAVQCEEYVLGEDGIFFKDELRKLYGLVAALHESVANHFLDVENYIYTDGLHVTWDQMPSEVALGLESTLQKLVDEQQWRPFINYNQELNATTECRNIITFPGNDYMEKPELERLYDAGKRYLKNHQKALTDEIDDVFFYIQMAVCPKCTWPEPFEDFYVNERYEAYVCSGCV
ncbi:hypothetical protein [Sporosarcina sp. UB5]|uniref:hypothetical protein n=1 Tax=Sporosarcina sp. UB5 TaxID=3047463 RepID=UPI003D79BA91